MSIEHRRKMEFNDNDIFGTIPSTSAFAYAPEKSEVAATVTETPESDINTNDGDASAIDQPSPEFLQRKLYFFLEHLKKMHSDLPE